MNMKPTKDAREAKTLNGNGAKQEPPIKQEQTVAQPLTESKMEKPVPGPESEPKPVSGPSPKPAPMQKTMPAVKAPGFLSSYSGGKAAYNKHLFPAYLKLSKILSMTMKEYTLGKLHSKIQREIKRLKDFSNDSDVREEALARFIKQLAVHILGYETRASANLRRKEPEMKSVSPDDINYLISSFDFRPWDR